MVSAIIAAGGRGERFGGRQLKQLLPVGGRPILERSVAAFLAHPDVDEVVVALPQALVVDPPAYLRPGDASALHGSAKRLRIVAGGARRQDSVANAFRAAAADSGVIVIHDAARPFASADLIARTIAAAAESGAALAAVQARDTVKQVELVLRPRRSAQGRQAQDERREHSLMLSPPKNERECVVTQTLDRESIYLAQTPQAFRRDVLRDALALDVDATDEAGLAELAGHTVRIVEGEASNIKITTPGDMTMAEAIAEGLRNADRGLRQADLSSGSEDQSVIPAIRSAIPNPQSAMTWAGTGYDLHRLVRGRPLVLGGVTIPSDRGALGHSDADVVCHAVTDAVLGAACLGDIGRHFPDSDPKWKGASSLDLLSRAVAVVAEQGLEVGNVDVTVILEAPKIRDHVDAMRAAVARAIGIDPARVSIKGKTNEGVDAVGRGEAIAAHAIALVRQV